MTAAAPARCPVPLTFLEEEIVGMWPCEYYDLLSTQEWEFDAAVARLRELGLLPEASRD